MSVLEISHLSDEFIKIPVRAQDSGNDVDPTIYTASIAFVRGSADPTGGDYATGTWETDASVSPSRYAIRRRATTLAVADYGIWAKITTGTETVQKRVGFLRVT